jgi:hypothetical protein
LAAISKKDDEIKQLHEFLEQLQISVRTDIYQAVKKLSAKFSQAQANQNATPNVIVAKAMEDKGYKCGSSHSPKSRKNCSKHLALSVPGELDYHTIIKVLAEKAEKSECDDLRRNKTNKSDSDTQMKAIDIMHKQLTQTVVLIIELVKCLLDESGESSSVKQGKRMYLLEYFQNVLKWVHDFEPEAVTFDHLMLPENLRTLHEFSRTTKG